MNEKRPDTIGDADTQTACVSKLAPLLRPLAGLVHVDSPPHAPLRFRTSPTGGANDRDVLASWMERFVEGSAAIPPERPDREAYRVVAHAAWMEITGSPMSARKARHPPTEQGSSRAPQPESSELAELEARPVPGCEE